MRRVAGMYGLEMNVRKSQVLLFNVERQVEEVEGIAVVEEVKYLGVRVQNRRNIFEKQRSDMICKAKRMSGMTYSVIEKGCHRVDW